MTAAPDNPAQTWRGLADQLTPEQIRHLEHYTERVGELSALRLAVVYWRRNAHDAQDQLS